MATVTVSPESFTTIKQISDERELSKDEAADYLIRVARGRLNALRKDNNRRAKGLPAPIRKVEVAMKRQPKPKAKAKKTAQAEA